MSDETEPKCVETTEQGSYWAEIKLRAQLAAKIYASPAFGNDVDAAVTLAGKIFHGTQDAVDEEMDAAHVCPDCKAKAEALKPEPS